MAGEEKKYGVLLTSDYFGSTATIVALNINTPKIPLSELYRVLKVQPIDIVNCEAYGFENLWAVVDDEGLLRERPIINYPLSRVVGRQLVGPGLLTRYDEAGNNIAMTMDEAKRIAFDVLAKSVGVSLTVRLEV